MRRDIYEYAMDRLAAGADAERVIQELTDAHIDSSRVRDIVGIASLAIIRRDYYEVLGFPGQPQARKSKSPIDGRPYSTIQTAISILELENVSSN